MTTITTAEGLAGYPPGTVFTDPTGSVWMIDGYRPDGTGPLLRAPERGPRLAADIIDQYGPLTLQWRPDQPPATVEPATVKPSLTEAREALGVTQREFVAQYGRSRSKAESILMETSNDQAA